MIVRAILEWDEEVEAYSATCPELNFISSCGDTKGEAVENLKEAIKLLLEPISKNLVNGDAQSDNIEILI